MALSFGKKAPSGSVGLDLDGGYAAAVQVSNGRVTRAASTALPHGVVREGEVVDEQALAAALKEFFKGAGLPRNVRLGVANQQIVVRQLELPRIEDADDRAAAIRFQAAEAIAMPLDEAVLDHQEVGQAISPEGAARDRLIVVAAREAMVSRLVGAVRAAGLRPEGVDLSAFALVRALAGAAPDEEKARVFCHLGGVTNLAVAVGRTCLFTRVLPRSFGPRADHFGQHALAAEAAASSAPQVPAGPDPAAPPGPAGGSPEPGASPESGTSPDVPTGAAAPTTGPPDAQAAGPQSPLASEAPTEPVAPDAATGAGGDGELDVNALAEEIRLSIDFYMGQPEARWVGEVTLAGPGAAQEGIAEELAPLVGLPVSVARPLGELDADGLSPDEDPHRHTVAAGLALGAAA
jgi:Tfp pilus assembly PilM family ATPase